MRITLSWWPLYLGEDVFRNCSGMVKVIFLSMIPKFNNMRTIKDLHPISLCNVVLYCLRRILANRLKKMLPHFPRRPSCLIMLLLTMLLSTLMNKVVRCESLRGIKICRGALIWLYQSYFWLMTTSSSEHPLVNLPRYYLIFLVCLTLYTRINICVFLH